MYIYNTYLHNRKKEKFLKQIIFLQKQIKKHLYKKTLTSSSHKTHYFHKPHPSLSNNPTQYLQSYSIENKQTTEIKYLLFCCIIFYMRKIKFIGVFVIFILSIVSHFMYEWIPNSIFSIIFLWLFFFSFEKISAIVDVVKSV